MTTKVKGLFKGLRYISQIFDEEKEPEFEIGFPTDVKHVAHIGWDGPSVDSPSWMKDFNASGAGHQSAPLSIGESKENPEIKWVSEDSSSRRSSRSADSPARDLPEVPKSTRRLSSTENPSSGASSPRKEKSRHSRRHHSKDSSDGSVKSSRQQDGSESLGRSHPDIPKKSRRKKSRESVPGGSSSSRSSSRSKGTSSGTYRAPFSDPGPDTDSSFKSHSTESSVRSLKEEDKESCGVF